MECFQSFLLVSADGISSRSNDSGNGSCKQNATVFPNAATHRRRNRFLLHRLHVAAAHALLIFMLMPLLVVKLTDAAPADIDAATVPPVVAITAAAAADAEVANIEAAAGHEASLTSLVNENDKVFDDSLLQSVSIDQLEESIRETVRMEIESNLEARETSKFEKSIFGEQTKNDKSVNVQNEENDQSKSQEENASLNIVEKAKAAMESKRGARNLDTVNEKLEDTVSEAINNENLETHSNAVTPELNDITKKTDLELEEPSDSVNNNEILEPTNEVTNKPEDQIIEAEEPHIKEETTSVIPVEEDFEKRISKPEEETPTSQDIHLLSEPVTTINDVAQQKEEAVQTEVTSLHTPEKADVVDTMPTVPTDIEVGNEKTTKLPTVVPEMNLLSIEDEIEHTSGQETTMTPEIKEDQHQVFKKEGVVEDNIKAVEEETRTGKALEESPVERPVEVEEVKSTDQPQDINGLGEQPQANTDDNGDEIAQPEAAVRVKTEEDDDHNLKKGTSETPEPLSDVASKENVSIVEIDNNVTTANESYPLPSADQTNQDDLADEEAALGINKDLPSSSDNSNRFLETTTATGSINNNLLRNQNKDVTSSEEVKVETEEDSKEDQDSQKNTSETSETLSDVTSNNAATAHKSNPPPNAGTTNQDNLADEEAAFGIGKALPSSSDNSITFLETTTPTESINSELLSDQNEDVSSSEEVQVEIEEDSKEDQDSQKSFSETPESLSDVASKENPSIAAADNDAATAHKSYPPPNAGQTHQDNLADEDAALGIGKALPSSSDNGNRFATNRSAMIIALCSLVAVMFIIVSLAMFLISFRRQHGTLDIEMQEQRCGKDNLDEEDAQLKLLEVELAPQVNVGSDETDECL